MKKRGVSPLLASVILVGFTITFAAFMFFNLSGTTKGTLGTVEDLKESSRLIDFKISLSPEISCDDIADQNFSIGNGDKCYSLLIENQMNEDISYVVRTIGDRGVQIANTPVFPAFSSKWIAVSYYEDVVGTENSVNAEIIPVSYQE